MLKITPFPKFFTPMIPRLAFDSTNPDLEHLRDKMGQISPNLALRSRSVPAMISFAEPYVKETDLIFWEIGCNEPSETFTYWGSLEHRRTRADDQFFWNFGGKGFSREAALLSLYMETLERIASSQTVHPGMLRMAISEVLESTGGPEGVLACEDLRNLSGKQEWAIGFDLIKSRNVWVHASYVFCPHLPYVGSRLHNSDFNGVASGHTCQDAILHGLSELVERDALMRTSGLSGIVQVVSESFLESLSNVKFTVNYLIQRGATFILLYLGYSGAFHTFGLVIFDEGFQDPVSQLTCGTHLDPVIAIERCFTEAMQTRANSIFVTDRMPRATRRGTNRALRDSFLRQKRLVPCELESIPTSSEIGSIQELLARRDSPFGSCVVVPLASSKDELEILRVISTTLLPLSSGTPLLCDNDLTRFSRRSLSS